MVTEGCQFGQERIYLNVTRVSLALLPGGDVEKVCVWLLCPLMHMAHAPQTILDSSVSPSVCGNSQGKSPVMKNTSILPRIKMFSKKHSYIQYRHSKHVQTITLS